MKKAGLITLLSLVVGAGSLVWADKGIKITKKNGQTTFISNDEIDHVQFMEDNAGNEAIGFKVVNGSQEVFYPASGIEKVEYVIDYQDQGNQDSRVEVEGIVRAYLNGMQVIYSETLTNGTGEVTVTGEGSQGKAPKVTVAGTTITVSLEGYPDGDYTVTIPSGYVTMGATYKNKEVSQVVNVEGAVNTTKKTKGRADGDEVKLVCAFETNDVNPVNAARYMLKDQQKALWDYVVLFSGNINYNNSGKKPYFNPDDLNRPYFHANDGIKYILDNKEEIIDPLREMGIKVIMGILPNHDAAGLLKLNSDGIEAFVEDLYQLHTKYGIDGFFWDEEYTASGSGNGLVASSDFKNFENLIIAVKEAMPNAVNLIYAYSSLDSGTQGNIKDWSPYINGILPDYSSSLNLTNYPTSWPGTDKTMWGFQSIEASRGNGSWVSKSIINNNSYCLQMIFAPGRPGYESTMDKACAELASSYYEDELDEELCPGNGINWISKPW